MCNAHNHPSGCNCGWGGVWYGGGGGGDFATWLFNKPKPVRKTGLQTATMLPLAGGLTKPNSTCPVCGTPVYYYESEYGGRVFFDELGPPWPKHPCTSHEPDRSSRQSTGRWVDEGWKPLTEVSIAPKSGEGSVYVVTGFSQGKKISFNFRADRVVMADIFRYRPQGAGVFDISILDYDSTRKIWSVWSGMGAVDPAKLTSDLRPAVIHFHTETVKVQTAQQPATTKKNQVKCRVCSVDVNEERIVSHLGKVHGVILVCVDGVVTGSMLV